MKKLLPLLLVSGFLCLGNGYAQPQKLLKGRVVSGDSTRLSYYSVQVVSAADTASKPITGSFAEPDFEMPCPFEGEVVLTVSSFGYKDHVQQVTRTPGQPQTDLGEIVLQIKPVQLQEVVVSSNKLQIERRGLNMTIKNIPGTALSEAGNLIDLLRRTPGVMVTGDDGISVIGRGAPLIYLNDRRVRDKSELEGIRSGDIKSVEVIRSPSARYDASTSSVLHIRTKSLLRDQLGASIDNATIIRRKISNISSVNLNAKKGIFSGNLNYQYTHSDYKDRTLSREVLTHPDGVFRNFTETEEERPSNRHNVFAGLNLNLSPKSVVGLQYSGVFSDRDSRSKDKQRIEEAGSTLDKRNRSEGNSHMDFHTVSASYTLTCNDHSSLVLVGDYTRQNQHSDRLLRENYPDKADYASTTSTRRNGGYDVYSFKGNYTFRLFDKDKNEVGGEYGHILNTGTTRITGSNPINDRYQKSRTLDDYFALYYAFDQAWDKWDLSLGLRYEYENNRLRQSGDDPALIDRKYSDLFPQASLTCHLTENTDLTLDYRRRIRRPSLTSLNPMIYYTDSLHYSTGNPALKPVFSNELSLTANIHGVSLSFSYTQMKNEIIYADLPEAPGSNVVVSRPINLNKSREMRLSAYYRYATDRFSGYVSAELVMPHSKIPYLDGTRTVNTPYFSTIAKVDYNVYKTLGFYLILYYDTPKNSTIDHFASLFSGDAGLSAKFFQKRLFVSVEGSDLFQGVSKRWWSSRYLNTYSWTKNYGDLQGIRFTVRYTFNTIKSGFRSKSGNAKLLNRL